MSLSVRPKQGCRWDLVSLGEVMLRFDPGEYRIWTTRHFAVSEGGGEYNVARGLKRCFGLETAIVTAFAKNPVGSLLKDLIYQGGVDSSLIRCVEYDGVGRTVRNGLNFTERGFGLRAAVGCSDRGHTAVSALKLGEIDWDAVFGERRALVSHGRDLLRLVRKYARGPTQGATRGRSAVNRRQKWKRATRPIPTLL